MEQPRVEVGGSAVPSVLVTISKEVFHQRGSFPVAGMIALQARTLAMVSWAVRKASSPKLSSVRPQRGSRARSAFGARITRA